MRKIFYMTASIFLLAGLSCGSQSISELNAQAKPADYYSDTAALNQAINDSGINCVKMESPQSSNFQSSCIRDSGSKGLPVQMNVYSREWFNQTSPYKGGQNLPGPAGAAGAAAGAAAAQSYEEIARGTIDASINVRKQQAQKIGAGNEVYFLVGPDWTVSSDLDSLKKIQSAIGGEIR